MRSIAAAAVFLAVLVGFAAWFPVEERYAFLAGAGAFAAAMVTALLVIYEPKRRGAVQ